MFRSCLASTLHLLFGLMLSVGFVHAQDLPAPYAVQLKDEIKLPDKIFQAGAPAIYELPALPQKTGFVPVLRARIFLQTPTAAGFFYNAQIKFNGTFLQRRMENGAERMKLRVPNFDLAATKQNFAVFRGDTIAAMFAPNGQVADAISTDNLASTFLLDLSDVARGVDNNVLEIIGRIPAKDFDPAAPEKAANLGRVVDASIGWLDNKYLAAPAVKVPQRKLLASTLKRNGMGLAVGERGGFALEFQGVRLNVETSLGVDEEAEELIADDAALANAPAVKVQRDGNGPIKISAQWASGLKLERTLQLESDHRLSWRETWENTGAADLAVPFNHRLFFNQSAAPEILLGGSPDAQFWPSSPFNPTAFIGSNGSKVSFGWVAEDDWLRQLLRLNKSVGMAKVLSRNFALAAGKSLSFDMSLQAHNSDSYFDFINSVRRRWNVNNIRIERPMLWGEPNSFPELKNYDWIIGPWMGLSLDAADAKKLDAEFKGKVPDDALQKYFGYSQRAEAWKYIKGRIDLAHKQSPRDRALIMMHPAMEVAYKPRLDLYPFADEAILNRDGKPFEDAGYTKSWLSSAMDNGWAVLYLSPRADNKYGRELLNRIRTALDESGADGIYSDEFTFATQTRVYSRYDYRQWDGYSVVLDEKGAIIARATDNAMATLPYQLAAVNEVKKRGKTFLVNSAPATRAMQNTGIYHFVEAGNGAFAGANAHLTTPLQFGNVGRPANVEEMVNVSRQLLNVGTLHVPFVTAKNSLPAGENFITRQYPITPQQLGAGFVVGKERIITSRNGDFDWPEKVSGAKVWKYSAQGVESAAQTIKKEKSNFTIDVPEKGLAIVEFIVP